MTVGGKVTVALPGWATCRLGESAGEVWASFNIQVSSRRKPEPKYPPAQGAKWVLSGRRLDILDPSPLDRGTERHRPWAGPRGALERADAGRLSVLGGAAFGAGARDLSAPLTPEADARAPSFTLLHDAPEYVMGDIISPFKAAMGGNYKEVENRLLGRGVSPLLAGCGGAGGGCSGRSSGPTRRRPSTRRCTWPGLRTGGGAAVLRRAGAGGVRSRAVRCS